MENKNLVILVIAVLAVFVIADNFGINLTGAAVRGNTGGWSFCSYKNGWICGAGQGDCDADDDCQTGLKCVNDVGTDYGFGKTIDVCEMPTTRELKCTVGGYRCEKDSSGRYTGWTQKCYSSSIGWENVEYCKNGCDGVTGQCKIIETETAVCLDSDVGKNYYVKGIAQGYPDTVQGSTYDCCKNSMEGGACVNSAPYLSEAICDGTTPSNIMYQCPNGCKDGVCIKETPPIPTKEVTYQGILDMLNRNCVSFETGDEGIVSGKTCNQICNEQGRICIATLLYRGDSSSKDRVALGGSCSTAWTTSSIIRDSYLDCLCCSAP